MISSECFYTEQHLWLKPEAGQVTIGVAEPIVRTLGPLISIELPDVDDELKGQVPFGQVEGLHETHQLYSPFEARVLEVNRDVIWDPTRLTRDPYDSGWLIRLEWHDQEELIHFMTSSPYEKFCREQLGDDYVND